MRNRLYGRSRSSRGTGFRLELTATLQGVVEEGDRLDVLETLRAEQEGSGTKVWLALTKTEKDEDSMGYNNTGTHPCISPTTVTGALTCTTLLSCINTSFVFSQISRKSASCRSCFFSSRCIHASRSKGAIVGG